MAKLIKLKKGFDLRLEGAIASAEVTDGEKSQHFAVIPDDFRGVIPRMEVKEGARVAAGDVLFHDKNHEEIKVVSPVAGVVKGVNRGERRKLESVVIEAAHSNERKQFDISARDAKSILLES